MGISQLEATALTVLHEQGFEVDALRVALALGELTDGSVQVVDDVLACALIGMCREPDLSLAPDPNPQLRIDRLAMDCLIAVGNAQHTMN